MRERERGIEGQRDRKRCKTGKNSRVCYGEREKKKERERKGVR